MKNNFQFLATCVAAFVLSASPVAGQITILKSNQLARVFTQLNEVDFETLPSPVQNLQNPIRLRGVTFADPGDRLHTGHCSSPTCVPDPDNATGANVVLFLNIKGTISFSQPRRIVVLDLQGSGTDRFTLRVTDAQRRKRLVVVQTVAFASTLLPLYSPAGITKVEIVRVGESLGPLVLARVLFSDPAPRFRAIPNGGPMKWPRG